MSSSAGTSTFRLRPGRISPGLLSKEVLQMAPIPFPISGVESTMIGCTAKRRSPMWDALRICRPPAWAQHLGRTYLLGCTLGCIAVEGLRAQEPEGDPVRDRVVALVERLGGQVRREE